MRRRARWTWTLPGRALAVATLTALYSSHILVLCLCLYVPYECVSAGGCLNKALVSINGRTHTRPFFRSWRHSAQHDACKVPTHERDRGDDVNTARELHPPPNKAALHLAQAISPSPHSPGEPSAQSSPKKLRWPGEGFDGRSHQDGAFQSPQPANFSPSVVNCCSLSNPEPQS